MSATSPKGNEQAKLAEKVPKREVEGFTQKKRRITGRINNKYLTSPNKMIPNEKYLKAYIKDAKKKANSGQGNKVFLQARYKNAMELLSRLEELKANHAPGLPAPFVKATRRKRHAFNLAGEAPVEGYFNKNGVFHADGEKALVTPGGIFPQEGAVPLPAYSDSFPRSHKQDIKDQRERNLTAKIKSYKSIFQEIQQKCKEALSYPDL